VAAEMRVEQSSLRKCSRQRKRPEDELQDQRDRGSGAHEVSDRLPDRSRIRGIAVRLAALSDDRGLDPLGEGVSVAECDAGEDKGDGELGACRAKALAAEQHPGEPDEQLRRVFPELAPRALVTIRRPVRRTSRRLRSSPCSSCSSVTSSSRFGGPNNSAFHHAGQRSAASRTSARFSAPVWVSATPASVRFQQPQHRRERRTRRLTINRCGISRHPFLEIEGRDPGLAAELGGNSTYR